MCQSTFPAEYPPKCPPDDALSADREFYLFIAGESPASEDFLSWHDKGICPEGCDYCQTFGLSVYLRKSDCEATGRLIRKFRNKKIAHATLCPEQGKYKKTPSKNSDEHHTLWMSRKFSNPANFFEVAE